MAYPTPGDTSAQFDTGSVVTVAPQLPANVPFQGTPSAPPRTVWTIAVDYSIDTGLRMMVPQGPIGTPSEFVRFKAPACVKRILWMADSWGAPPKIPSTDTGSLNEVLLFWSPGGSSRGQAADGTYVYHNEGIYFYGLQVPPGPNDNLSLAVGDYDTGDITVNFISANAFLKKFVGPSQNPSAFNLPGITY